MEHSRKASVDGWRKLAGAAVVASGLGLGTLFFDMGVAWRIIWTLVVLLVLGVAVAYSVANIRNDGTFVCRLTDEEFSQSIPVPSCGDSFKIKLSQITQIEVHDGQREGPSDEWFIHTKDDRHRITSNYGNPDRRFGEAIQKALPQIETIET